MQMTAGRKPRSNAIIEALVYGMVKSASPGDQVELTCLFSGQIHRAVRGG